MLGIELAGTVAALGPGVTRFRVGDRVMGPLGGLGAYAELAAVNEQFLCLAPEGLSDREAAGPVTQGQRILIHSAGGRLGGFAMQFASRLGASVIATARGADRAYLIAQLAAPARSAAHFQEQGRERRLPRAHRSARQPMAAALLLSSY